MKFSNRLGAMYLGFTVVSFLASAVAFAQTPRSGEFRFDPPPPPGSGNVVRTATGTTTRVGQRPGAVTPFYIILPAGPASPGTSTTPPTGLVSTPGRFTLGAANLYNTAQGYSLGATGGYNAPHLNANLGVALRLVDNVNPAYAGLAPFGTVVFRAHPGTEATPGEVHFGAGGVAQVQSDGNVVMAGLGGHLPFSPSSQINLAVGPAATEVAGRPRMGAAALLSGVLGDANAESIGYITAAVGVIVSPDGEDDARHGDYRGAVVANFRGQFRLVGPLVSYAAGTLVVDRNAVSASVIAGLELEFGSRPAARAPAATTTPSTAPAATGAVAE